MLPAANFPIPNIPTNCEDNLADLPPTVCTSLLSPILGFLLMVAAPTLPVSQYEFFAEASAAVPGNQVFPF